MRNLITLTPETISQGTLVLVNAKHALSNEKENTLVQIESDYASIKMQKNAATVLMNLLKSIGGQGWIVPVSGYRPETEQRQIYEDSLKENGEIFTQKFVALPGHSEHQTGLAIDLGLRKENIDFICPDFPYEGICQKFRNTAVQYGFIERYQKDKEEVTGIAHEPWHFRYVGYPHAQIMTDEHLALEEYIDYLKQYEFGKKHWQGTIQSYDVEVFYVPVSENQKVSVELPECLAYQVSGNNVDGCIVTVWKS